MIYRYIKADGSHEKIVTEKPLELSKLQELVGGYIEFTSGQGCTFCVNEEGLIRDLPVNKTYPEYRGDVVLGFTDSDGEFVGEVD